MAKTLWIKKADFKNWISQEKNGLKDSFYIYPKRKFLFSLLAVLVMLWAMLRVWIATSFQTTKNWDHQIVAWTGNIRTPFLDNFFTSSTLLGSEYFIIGLFLILAVILFKNRRRKAATTVFLTLAGSLLLISLLKNIFGRPRPFGCFNGNDCFSFPSGHATLSFYFYGMLFYLITRFLKPRRRAVWLIGLGLLTLIGLVALSRIYLGLHFPTDIIGGFLLGGIWLIVAIVLIDFLYR